MTVQSLETKVRGIINDSVQPYRWSQSKVKEYLQLAMRRLNVIAPHTRYLADGSIVDEVELPNDNNAVVPVSNRYEEALAYYAAHLCYLLRSCLFAKLLKEHIAQCNIEIQTAVQTF